VSRTGPLAVPGSRGPVPLDPDVSEPAALPRPVSRHPGRFGMGPGRTDLRRFRRWRRRGPPAADQSQQPRHEERRHPFREPSHPWPPFLYPLEEKRVPTRTPRELSARHGLALNPPPLLPAGDWGSFRMVGCPANGEPYPQEIRCTRPFCPSSRWCPSAP
jgi:hypothetical protein